VLEGEEGKEGKEREEMRDGGEAALPLSNSWIIEFLDPPLVLISKVW